MAGATPCMAEVSAWSMSQAEGGAVLVLNAGSAEGVCGLSQFTAAQMDLRAR